MSRCRSKAVSPIPRTPPAVCYREDDDLSVVYHVDDGVGEVLHQNSPDRRLLRNPGYQTLSLWLFTNQRDSGPNGRAKPTSGLGASRAVPANSIEILGRSFFV